MSLPEVALLLLCAVFHGRAGQLGLTQAGDALDSGTVNQQIFFGIVLPIRCSPPDKNKLVNKIKHQISKRTRGMGKLIPIK